MQPPKCYVFGELPHSPRPNPLARKNLHVCLYIPQINLAWVIIPLFVNWNSLIFFVVNLKFSEWHSCPNLFLISQLRKSQPKSLLVIFTLYLSSSFSSGPCSPLLFVLLHLFFCLFFWFRPQAWNKKQLASTFSVSIFYFACLLGTSWYESDWWHHPHLIS